MNFREQILRRNKLPARRAAPERVGAAGIFPGRTAARFLAAARPDIHSHGGDYTLETAAREERRVVEQDGGNTVIVPVMPGKSAASLWKKSPRL